MSDEGNKNEVKLSQHWKWEIKKKMSLPLYT